MIRIWQDNWINFIKFQDGPTNTLGPRVLQVMEPTWHSWFPQTSVLGSALEVCNRCPSLSGAMGAGQCHLMSDECTPFWPRGIRTNWSRINRLKSTTIKKIILSSIPAKYFQQYPQIVWVLYLMIYNWDEDIQRLGCLPKRMHSSPSPLDPSCLITQKGASPVVAAKAIKRTGSRFESWNSVPRPWCSC